MCEVIKVYRYCCLTEKLNVFDTDLLVLSSLLLSLLRVCLERLTKLINTALLSRFIDLH